MFDSECNSTLSLIDSDLSKTLTGIGRGIEKEGLRVTQSNHIAQSMHPVALGSTLTHPSITTDYSEALLEFITPKNESIEGTVNYLTDLHRFTVDNIGDELVWPASMPCKLEGDQSIPIAEYGSSNTGTLKHVYRQGLGLRYGRIMQSIAGVHYNFSLSDEFWKAYQEKLSTSENCLKIRSASLQDFKSEQYFSLIRNFRRYSWILAYLFGASPVLDKSFLNGRDHELEPFSEDTLGLKYATSLRMSDLGYQNTAQEELHVCYNSLDDYVTTLAKAMKVKYAPYEKIGVKVDGEYKQLNTNIDEEQIRFLDTFLLYCLLSLCPLKSDTGCPEIKSNLRNVILKGRDPELKVCQDGNVVLDHAHGGTAYIDAISAQKSKVINPDITPSGKIMTMLGQGKRFLDIAREQAEIHKNYFQSLDANTDFEAELLKLAKSSLKEQENMEKGDRVSFSEFLDDYNRS